MKETVNANIGSVAFTLDDDAYRALKRYLKRIENRLPEEDKDTLGDIERRVAELLSEKIHHPQLVVTLAEVEAAMQQIGDPDTFGKARVEDTDTEEAQEPKAKTRLYRPRTTRCIGGVCAAFANYFGGDATLFRLITFMLIFFGGLSIWIYVILWIVLPQEPAHEFTLNKE